jgi:hypothetical protein
MMTREEKIIRIEELEAELASLMHDVEEETIIKRSDESWPPKTFYWWYHITTGSILGSVGAIVSLFFNVIGSVLFDKHPFELIKIFMTFPMGGSALASDSDVTLIIGIILYIVTGAFYGVIFEVLMYRFFSKSTRSARVAVAIALGLGIWIVNFYGILSWLQPMLFGGNWILTMIPFWVAALTHIVFALAMVFIGEWGHFEATDYKRQAMVREELRITN